MIFFKKTSPFSWVVTSSSKECAWAVEDSVITTPAATHTTKCTLSVVVDTAQGAEPSASAVQELCGLLLPLWGLSKTVCGLFHPLYRILKPPYGLKTLTLAPTDEFEDLRVVKNRKTKKKTEN